MLFSIIEEITDFISDVLEGIAETRRSNYYRREDEINLRIEAKKNYINQIIADNKRYEILVKLKLERKELYRLTNEAFLIFLDSRKSRENMFANMNKIEEMKRELYFSIQKLKNKREKEIMVKKLKELKKTSILLREFFYRQVLITRENYQKYLELREKRVRLSQNIEEGFTILHRNKLHRQLGNIE